MFRDVHRQRVSGRAGIQGRPTGAVQQQLRQRLQHPHERQLRRSCRRRDLRVLPLQLLDEIAARRLVAGHLHGQLRLRQQRRAELHGGRATRPLDADRQAQRQPRFARRNLRIQSREHVEQRPELLVPGRPARVLLQPRDARSVLHPAAAGQRTAGGAVHRLQLPDRPVRFRRIRCRPCIPTAQPGTCC